MSDRTEFEVGEKILITDPAPGVFERYKGDIVTVEKYHGNDFSVEETHLTWVPSEVTKITHIVVTEAGSDVSPLEEGEVYAVEAWNDGDPVVDCGRRRNVVLRDTGWITVQKIEQVRSLLDGEVHDVNYWDGHICAIEYPTYDNFSLLPDEWELPQEEEPPFEVGDKVVISNADTGFEDFNGNVCTIESVDEKEDVDNIYGVEENGLGWFEDELESAYEATVKADVEIGRVDIVEDGEVVATVKPDEEPGGVTDQVVSDLREREQIGIERYGESLQTWNGREAAQDAYEEALDLAQYLKQMLIERRALEDYVNHLERRVSPIDIENFRKSAGIPEDVEFSNSQ